MHVNLLVYSHLNRQHSMWGRAPCSWRGFSLGFQFKTLSWSPSLISICSFFLSLAIHLPLNILQICMLLYPLQWASSPHRASPPPPDQATTILHLGSMLQPQQSVWSVSMIMVWWLLFPSLNHEIFKDRMPSYTFLSVKILLLIWTC